MDDDSQLLQRYLAGEDSAFTAIVLRHGAWVVRSCERRLRVRDEAEDAGQAVFVILGRQASGIRDGAALAAWLHRAAQLECSNRLRMRKRRCLHEAAASPANVVEDDPSRALESADLREHLDEAVAELPEGQREAVICHFFQGLPRDAVAKRLGCGLEAVHKRIQTACAQLRERLQTGGLVVAGPMLEQALDFEAKVVAQAVAPKWAASAILKGGLSAGAKMAWVLALVISGVLALTVALLSKKPQPVPVAVAEPVIEPALVADVADMPQQVVLVGGNDFQCLGAIGAAAAHPTQPLAVFATVTDNDQSQLELWQLETHQRIATLKSPGVVTWCRFVEIQGEVRLLVRSVDLGEEFGSTNELLCLDMESGAIRWRTPALDVAVSHDAHFAAIVWQESGTPAHERIPSREGVRIINLATGSIHAEWQRIGRDAEDFSWSINALAFSQDDCELLCLDTFLQNRVRLRVADGLVIERGLIAGLENAYETHITQIESGSWLIENGVDWKLLRDGSEQAESWSGEVPGIPALRIESGSLQANARTWELPETLAGIAPTNLGLASARFLIGSMRREAVPLVVDLERDALLAPGPSQQRRVGIRHHVAADGTVYIPNGASAVARYDHIGQIVSKLANLNAWGDDLCISANAITIVGGNGDGTISYFRPNGSELWRITDAHGQLDHLWLAPTGEQVLSTGLYDGACALWSASGEMLWRKIPPKKSDTLHQFSIQQAAWQDDRLLIADLSDMKHNTPKESSESRSGIWSLADGSLLHRFVNDAGIELRQLDDLLLRPGHAHVYVRQSPSRMARDGSRSGNPASDCFGLCSSQDGTFVRKLTNPGMLPVFSRDGRWLTGTLGRVDCESGALVINFATLSVPGKADTWVGQGGRRPSPSGSRIACLDADTLHIFDTRTLVPIARWPIAQLGAGKQVNEIAWWPDERMLALTYADDVRMALLPLRHGVEMSVNPDEVLGSIAAGRLNAHALLGTEATATWTLQRLKTAGGDGERVALMMLLEELAHSGDKDALAAIQGTTVDGLIKDTQDRMAATVTLPLPLRQNE
jgi:RNA polymerase sigma-70 factor (ECF subfamily)